MAAPKIIDAKDSSHFDKILQDSGQNVVVVHFHAPWSDQCSQMNEVINELAKDSKYIHVQFVKIEAESLPEVSEKYEIQAVPTFVFIKDKELVDRLDGANAPDLTEKVNRLVSSNVGVVSSMSPKENLDNLLKKLIASHPVMVFMKGSPDNPRCGFSKQLVSILADHDAKYGHFDILTDNDVRQGLKKYSDWPTYPQLYVNSELVGGLDIIKEMVESGDFASTLPK